MSEVKKFLQDFLQENMFIKILCLCLSCILWVNIMIQRNPTSDTIVEVPLRQVNTTDDKMLFNAPDKVQVKVRASRTKLRENLAQEINAYLDMSTAKIGQQRMEVKASFASGQVIDIKPNIVSVYVDTVENKNVPIVVRTTGNDNKDRAIGSYALNPAHATIRGATHIVDAIDQVVALVDTAEREQTFIAECTLLPIGAEGETVSHVSVTPTTAALTATMVDLKHTVELPINLVTVNNIPDDVVIVRREIIPDKISLTAPPSVLAKMEDIKTKPVDLSQLTNSMELVAELDLDTKVIPEVRTVQVRFSVERKNTR